MNNKLLLISLFALLFVFSCDKSDTSSKKAPLEGPLFQQVDPAKAGISFENTIKETEKYNHFIWANIYNGGGVAVADINNDGLQDLFFSGNIVGDALYLNKGNLEFTDITTSAGILQDGSWSSGVTVGDVNQDGFLDFYVCRTGPSMTPEERRNLLYINNGDNTFAEKSEEYGVAFTGFSTQATLFDMDNDGDLDLFVANQPPDSRFIGIFDIDVEVDKEQWTDKLYRNNGKGKFVEISQAAGVNGFGYGLNAVASDLNGDNLTDLYVSNDYFEPDFLYINNGDLTFTNTINESIKHISNFAMGSDVADFNNDNLLDISVVDMAAADHFRSKTNMGSMRPERFWNNVANGKHYQFMFNTLQLNNGNGSFSEIGLQAGISKTDWSWSILMSDLDNDGFKDITVTNGIQRDIRNNDVQLQMKNLIDQGQTDFKALDVVNLIPSTPLANYAFKNNGNYEGKGHSLSFTNVAEDWGLAKPGFSAGMVVADLDNDGDLDVVMNNVSAPAAVYENRLDGRKNYIRFKLESQNGHVKTLNAKVTVKYQGESQFVEITGTRGYLSCSETTAHFGLGDVAGVDEVNIVWPDGKISKLTNPEINKTHIVSYESATAGSLNNSTNKGMFFAELTDKMGFQYQHKENEYDDFLREILLPHKQSQHGPHIAAGDVNGDGLEDFFVGGAIGFSGVLYLQQTGEKFAAAPDQAWSADKNSEDLGALFFDADDDDDLDLYVVSGGSEFDPNDSRYQDRFYRNNGDGSFSKDNNALPKFAVSGEAVTASDVDADGDLDLFVGGRLVPGQYPAPEDSYLLRNEGGNFVDATDEAAPSLRQMGMVTDAIFSDFDSDGDDDLIIVGEWMNIRILQNNGGQFTDISDESGLAESRAWWWSIAAGDFDGDGDEDYVIGNLGENTKFKASPEKPFMVYGSDFDQNGTNDVVLANYSGDQIVPVRGRECSSEQMPFIAEKFPTYEEFARAELTSIFPAQTLEQSVNYKIHSFESILLKNDSGRFTTEALPPLAQVAPIRDFAILDVNDDGNLDVVGVGNMYQAEVETIRYDAGVGVCLLGDGAGHFKPVSTNESGWFTPFDARSIARVEGSGKSYFLVGNNQNMIQVFDTKRKPM